MASEHPQFDYWRFGFRASLSAVLKISARTKIHFLQSVSYQNYSMNVRTRPLSLRSLVHVNDFISLKNNNPLTHAEFLTGSFVIQKTRRKFSSLAHEQVHEQLNAIVKGDDGIIGLTENEAALTRWTVSGPETARLLMEYV